ncbi:cupin domain-containing protein [Timonella senegalensis]|uniref:cupin domain-containing protein n=1 Tax=Timonella senegalensis TaxID=1465825 RepID=UPI00030D46F5|nr:cupin domain-containing protein [Timonella senegalensis]
MKQAHRQDAEFRFETWGPAYLLKSETLDVGVVRLEPGHAMENHYHAHGEETFIVTAGILTVWLETTNSVELGPGSIYQCERGEMHRVSNDHAEDCEFYFLKTPPVSGDTISVPWNPGEPALPSHIGL